MLAGDVIEYIDDRDDYGEERMITIGRLGLTVVVVVWTERGDTRRIISMRRAVPHEERAFWKQFG